MKTMKHDPQVQSLKSERNATAALFIAGAATMAGCVALAAAVLESVSHWLR